MITPQRTFGNHGESLVAKHLEQDGFVICARNYTRRGGEIDIVAEKKGVRAFIEVKTRKGEYFCLSQLITHQKQRKIINTAYLYNTEHGWSDTLAHRFDVALLVQQNGDYMLTYIPNAFVPGDEWI